MIIIDELKSKKFRMLTIQILAILKTILKILSIDSDLSVLNLFLPKILLHL